MNEELATLLCINEHCDTRQAAAIKILLNHPDLNMQPESCHTCWAGCVHAERLSWLENCRDNEYQENMSNWNAELRISLHQELHNFGTT